MSAAALRSRPVREIKLAVFRWIASALLALTLVSGCWGESAEQMMKTAEFEELQRNHEHARQLYARIIAEHPDSPEAKKAAERLAAPNE